MAEADNPADESNALLRFLETVVNVERKCSKLGATTQEALVTATPFAPTAVDQQAVLDMHSLLQAHAALGLLLGEDYHSPMTSEQILAHAGLTEADLTSLSPEDILRRLSTAPPLPQGSFRDKVNEAADLLFQERYGYPDGTAKSLTLQQLWLAIEHALEDKPSDPKGVWKITS